MVLHNPAPPMQGFVTDQQDEIARRMKDLYKPDQRDRYKFVEKPENWLKASDPVAMCREFSLLVLSVYTYSRTMDIGFKGDVCAGPKESVRQWRTTNAHVWRSLGDFNLVAKTASVKAPVLVIHGIADVIPLRGSEFWAYGYPNGRLLIIEKAGHITHVERADVFFPAVEMFLNGSFPAEAKKVIRDW
jgi:pimeloyl-ACP methyl ester carboxylesterase